MKRKVLFLCVKNSSRSQMAEILLNYRGGDRFEAVSAGSRPVSSIYPLTLRLMEKSGFDLTGKRPKSINEYINEEFDFIITLCDKMKEECPVFPGQPIFAHWGTLDPEDFEGTEEEKYRQVEKALLEIANRVNLFINLPIEKLDRMALELKVNEIGKIKVE